MERVWITCGKVLNIRLCTIFYTIFERKSVNLRDFWKRYGEIFISFLSENHEKSHQYKVFRNANVENSAKIGVFSQNRGVQRGYKQKNAKKGGFLGQFFAKY